jgi:hypothetical protein
MTTRILAAALLACVALTAQAGATVTETLLFVRHAEKQPDDLGQLTCQGLNRALALPAVLRQRYGRPDAIFAPDPAQRNHGFNYVRPLATIEPTAIALAMPVNTDYGWNDVDSVADALTRADLKNATVWVAWEHKEAVKILRKIAQLDTEHHVDIPDWDGKDFDRISILTVRRDGKQLSVGYRQEREGLDNQPLTCP